MIRTVLQLRAAPGRAAELVRVFHEQKVLEHSRAMAGCQAVEIFRSLDDPDLCVVFADWDDVAAYQGWLAYPQRPGMTAALQPLLAEPAATQIIGGRYEPAVAG
jgi:quinol monooxygenase YgiN